MSNYFHSITYLESECLQSDINVSKIAHLFQKREKQNGQKYCDFVSSCVYELC